MRVACEEQVLLEALAQKEVSQTALLRELEIFKLQRCAMVFGLLKDDLRVSSGSCKRAAQLFGSHVQGHSFQSLLIKEDRQHFAKLCARAEHSCFLKRRSLRLLAQERRFK